MLFIQHPLSPLTAGGRREAHFLRDEDEADNNEDDDEWVVTASFLLSSSYSSGDVHMHNCDDDLFLPLLSVLWVPFQGKLNECGWVHSQVSSQQAAKRRPMYPGGNEIHHGALVLH